MPRWTCMQGYNFLGSLIIIVKNAITWSMFGKYMRYYLNGDRNKDMASCELEFILINYVDTHAFSKFLKDLQVCGIIK
jgi:hypothetical protein